MTTEQSKKLKVGNRVYFNGDQSDRGAVTAYYAIYVTIQWEDGHRSYSGHRSMKGIETMATMR